MTDVRTIVAATDFSPGSGVALEEAARLAGRSGAALHVLHADVHYRSSGDSPDDAALPEASPSSLLRLQTERFAEDVLTAAVLASDGLDAEPGPSRVTVAVVRGITAAAAILRYADRVGAGLIVAGSHGRSALARLLLGSVAEALTTGARCPVLIVPDVASSAERRGPVLVAVDLSARSRDALAAGRAFAGLLHAPLELVHVVEGGGPYPALASDVFAVADAAPDWEADAMDRLGRLAAGGPRPDVLHAVLGEPGRAIASLASDRDARLVVVAPHGRTGIVSALAGRTATSVLRRSGCPVLSVDRVHPTSPASPDIRSALARSL